MHYTPNVDLAFLSVEHIMRDVSGGWLLRYLHANGASMLDGELESFVIFAPLVLRTSQAQSSAWSYGPVKRSQAPGPTDQSSAWSYGPVKRMCFCLSPRTLERPEAVLTLPRIRSSTPWKNSFCSRKRLHEKSVHLLVVPTGEY